MSNEGCFTVICPPFCIICELKNEYLMRDLEKGCQKAWATVKMKTSIFNLQYLRHFCIDLCKKYLNRSTTVKIPFNDI